MVVYAAEVFGCRNFYKGNARNRIVFKRFSTFVLIAACQEKAVVKRTTTAVGEFVRLSSPPLVGKTLCGRNSQVVQTTDSLKTPDDRAVAAVIRAARVRKKSASRDLINR